MALVRYIEARNALPHDYATNDCVRFVLGAHRRAPARRRHTATALVRADPCLRRAPPFRAPPSSFVGSPLLRTPPPSVGQKTPKLQKMRF